MPDELEIPPTYKEVAEDIVRLIDEGLYPYGTLLPSTAELVAQYNVSPGTIARAMALLTEQGAIIGRQGRGRYVARRA